MNKLGGGGSVVVKTVTQAAPITIHAVSKPVVSLTQYGKVTQNGTPTPPTPKDLVCNNGALKMVDDELPTGYKRVLGFTCDNNAVWEIDGFHLKGSDTVRISFSVNAGCNVFGCYQGADATDNYDLFASVSAGAKYFRYGGGTYLSSWSPDDLGQRFDVVYTSNGSQGMPQDSTWTPRTFTSANNLLIGSTTLTSTSSKLKGNLYGNVVVDGRLKLIPCERVSDNVLGYYDTYSETFYEPYEGYDGAVSLGYDGSHYSLATVGTPEVLSIGTQTASVADLFAVGNYKDTHELIGGTVTSRVGAYVFDGTEQLSTSTAYGSAILFSSAAARWGAVKNSTPLCTHFTGLGMISSGTAAENTCFFNASGHFYFRTSMSKADFTTFLAEQYAAGTPVIVLYPLATATTEQVTAQPLHTAKGTNTVSVGTKNTIVSEQSITIGEGATSLTAAEIAAIQTLENGDSVVVTIDGVEYPTTVSKSTRLGTTNWCIDAGDPEGVVLSFTANSNNDGSVSGTPGTYTIKVEAAAACPVDPVDLTVVYKGTEDGGSGLGDDDPGEVPFD